MQSRTSRGFQSADRAGGRGVEGKGRGRGRGGFSRPPRDLHPVPSRSQVRPGSAVSIVLKEDQSTGREVQGNVQDVLTSGDHPRGIKVRLTDGRVGRVQRMSNAPVATPSQGANEIQSISTVTSDQGIEVYSNRAAREEDSGHGPKLRYRDVGLDDDVERAPEALDLAAYIKPAKVKKGAKKKAEDEEGTKLEGEEKPLARCPVCGEFEGDEAAVNHHVATHFD